MADTKISALTAVSAPALTDEFPVVQGGVTKRETLTQARTVLVPIVLTADVSGTLPSANAPSHLGDVTGTHAVTVVAKINGATVPAAGALTTGNAPYVSGVSALTYSALNLAGGAGWISGTLPVANGGTGFTAFGAGVATFLQTPSSANLATAVTDETGTGALVFANTPTLVTPVIGAATGTSVVLSGLATVGGVSSHGDQILGLASATSPYGVHGLVEHSFATDANYTVTAAQYLYDTIVLTEGALTAGRVVSFPLPSAADKSYQKTVRNNTAFSLDIRTVTGGSVRALPPGYECRFQFSAFDGCTFAGVPYIHTSGGVTAISTTTLTNKTIALASNTLTGTSAEFKTACSDETGSGALCFATSPTLTTPVINGQTQGATVAVAALEIGWTLGAVFTKTLAAGGNTFTFAGAASGMVIVVRLTSNGGGSTVTWPTVKWAGGAAPTQTSTGIDVYTFVHDGTSIYGSVVQAMA